MPRSGVPKYIHQETDFGRCEQNYFSNYYLNSVTLSVRTNGDRSRAYSGLSRWMYVRICPARCVSPQRTPLLRGAIPWVEEEPYRHWHMSFKGPSVSAVTPGRKIELLDDKRSSITLGMSATTISFTAPRRYTQKSLELALPATSQDVPAYNDINFPRTALAVEMQGESFSLFLFATISRIFLLLRTIQNC